MSRSIAVVLSAALLLGITACGPADGQSEVPTQEVRVIEVTSSAQVECPPTEAPTTLDCPTPAVLEKPAARARTAYVSSGNLTLRAGPSIAHPALASFPSGAVVKILGKAPGGSWVAVSVPGGQLGWMYTLYLGIELPDPLADVPEVEPAQSRVIEGLVTDDTGQPVENVGVSVALGGAANYPDFTDAHGRFVLFVPDSQPGPWVVEIQGVGCLSRLVDANCQLVSHVLREPRQVYEQGQLDPISFVYEETGMRLQGSVVDASGSPYGGAGVFATRSDGAYVTGQADSSGSFDIPITPGTWELMATRGRTISIEIPAGGYSGELILVGSPQ